MRLSIGLLATTLCAGAVLAQEVYVDQFDSYGEGYLSVINPDWTIDACYDARIIGDEPYSPPNSSRQYKEGNEGKLIGVRNKHVFTTAELMSVWDGEPDPDPPPNCIRGRTGNTLKVEYKFHSHIQASNYSWANRFVEVVCGNDRAPTGMIHTICNEGLPTEKHRYHLDNVSSDPNATGAPVHASIAAGLIALADPDPCTPTESQTVYRLVVYDGQYWRIIKDYPTAGVDLHACWGWNWIKMEISSSTIFLSISNKYNPDSVPGDHKHPCNASGSGAFRTTMTTTIDRKYLGDFTAVVMGGLIMEDAEDPADPYRPVGNCWGERNGGGIDDVVNYIDDIYVTDGVSKYMENPCIGVPPPTGACCYADHQAHPEKCADGVEAANCTGDDIWREGEACGETLCCPKPWADIDLDDDVDQTDFGLWQVCFTGENGSVNSGCECYDRDDSTGAQGGDGLDVDGQDFNWFANCFTGPTVPLNIGSPPADCIP